MAAKLRVHELAKELGYSNEDMLKLLHAEGIEAASHLSSVDADLAELVREHVTDIKKKASSGPVVVTTMAVELEAELEKEDTRHRGRTPKKRSKAEDDSAALLAAQALIAPAAPEAPADEEPEANTHEIHLKPPIVVRDLAEALGMKPNALIQELMMSMSVFAAINQTIDIKVAETICTRHNCVLVAEKRTKMAPTVAEETVEPEAQIFDDEATDPRPPVVTVLGHVDHGKTSLLDSIRKSKVVDGEAGGITQHVGASQVEYNGHQITFIDTPGHEAFSSMRARGANVTDIAILVVAANDGFMPQTIEALSHAKAAKVTIIVAANKCDLPDANLERVHLQMSQNGLNPEPWGGDVAVIPVSALKGTGINDLLDRILLEAEILELKANAKLPVKAVVVESQLEQGHGPTVNVLVKNGTLHQGDIVLCGQDFGRVKALIGPRGERLKEAGPSTPVKVVGLSGLPESGSLLVACKDEREARELADDRRSRTRQENLRTERQTTIEDLFKQMDEDKVKELRVVVKTDVQGTCEAVVAALDKLNSSKVRMTVLHATVGAITDNDVLLASASQALLVGFHVRVMPGVNNLAKREGVKIMLFSIIYDLVQQVRNLVEGMIDPEYKEVAMGKARIKEIFELRVGKICGCEVLSGTVKTNAKARVVRAGELIYNGSVSSLRRFQDDVKEVRAGLECGIRLDQFNDFEKGDEVEIYDFIAIKGTLTV